MGGRTRTTISTAEEARALRAKSPSPNLKHGATGALIRTGMRRCQPGACVKRADCKIAELPEERRPVLCPVLEQHQNYLLRNLRRQPGLTPARLFVCANVMRLESAIVQLAWYLEAEGVLTKDSAGKVQAQPMLNVYRQFISEQNRALAALGAPEAPRQDFAQAHAAALEALDVTPAKSGDGQ